MENEIFQNSLELTNRSADLRQRAKMSIENLIQMIDSEKEETQTRSRASSRASEIYIMPHLPI